MLDPKRILKAVLIFAAGIFAIIYMYHQVAGTRKTEFETRTALAVTLENSVDTTGYIVRDERLIPLSTSGTVFSVVEDGKKVSAGSAVANVYINAADASGKSRIDEIDQKLEILENSTVDQEFFSVDAIKLENDKNEILGSIINNKAKNNFSQCISKKKDLLISMNKLATVKSGVSFEEQIKALEQEKSKLSSTEGATYTRIYSPVSGYYYGVTDGYETSFTPGVLEDLTVDKFEKLSNTQPDNSITASSAGKIVVKSRWYLMCGLPKADTVPFKQGKNYAVQFPYAGNITVNMTVDSIVSETDRDTVIIVFTTDYMPETFDYTRTQKIEIVSESYSGLKIPKAAMRMLPDGTKGVYVQIGETIHFRRAEEIYQFDDSYIIRQENDEEKQQNADQTEAEQQNTDKTVNEKYQYLSLYDSVIIGGKDLYDGKRIS